MAHFHQVFGHAVEFCFLVHGLNPWLFWLFGYTALYPFDINHLRVATLLLDFVLGGYTGYSGLNLDDSESLLPPLALVDDVLLFNKKSMVD